MTSGNSFRSAVTSFILPRTAGLPRLVSHFTELGAHEGPESCLQMTSTGLLDISIPLDVARVGPGSPQIGGRYAGPWLSCWSNGQRCPSPFAIAVVASRSVMSITAPESLIAYSCDYRLGGNGPSKLSRRRTWKDSNLKSMTPS